MLPPLDAGCAGSWDPDRSLVVCLADEGEDAHRYAVKDGGQVVASLMAPLSEGDDTSVARSVHEVVGGYCAVVVAKGYRRTFSPMDGSWSAPYRNADSRLHCVSRGGGGTRTFYGGTLLTRTGPDARLCERAERKGWEATALDGSAPVTGRKASRLCEGALPLLD